MFFHVSKMASIYLGESEAFWSWLASQKPVLNSRMDKGVNYVFNWRETAATYLEDERCNFTNNLSENTIRLFGVESPNWLFSSFVDRANASAVVYTLVEIAKAHNLNTYGYLYFLLDHPPSKDMIDEQLADLAPWSKKLQSIKNRKWIIVNYSNSKRDVQIASQTEYLCHIRRTVQV